MKPLVFFCCICATLGCADSNGTDKSMDGGGSGDGDADADGDADGNSDADSDAECESPADCTLQSDCCSCLALGPEDDMPRCTPDPCFTDMCPTIGATEALCAGGHCVLNLSCDSSTVTCRMATPVCDADTIPIVDEAGTCWTQGCVAPDQCSAVTSCADCLDGQTCIEADGRRSCY